MNRQERRRLERQGRAPAKEPVINMKQSDIQTMKNNATHTAIDTAFLLMLGFPVMAMRDNMGWGPVRLERLVDWILDYYDSFEKGYITLDDVHDTLREETGITIQKKGKK